jgi:UDP-3-O-[3-hydroxymyristoyl] glucosamine N-acyltransferase
LRARKIACFEIKKSHYMLQKGKLLTIIFFTSFLNSFAQTSIEGVVYDVKGSPLIGANVIILPGVTIGKNSVVGAGSIVTKSIEDKVIAVGNPARIIKKID